MLKEKKLLIAVIIGIVLLVILSIVRKEEMIHIEPSSPLYIGEWKALHNQSHAKVSIRDEEQYDIRYTNVGCNILFSGTIYTINIENNLFRILKLDIDKTQSECYYLNTLFAPSKFVFKFESLTPEYAKLKFPSVDDLELFLEHAEGSESNLESMIRLLRTKSELLTKMEQIVLEYRKKE